MIRVTLPPHLRKLAQVEGEVTLNVEGPVTQRSVLDALETSYPMLRGTIRDHVTQKRRAFVRFFACGEDLSHEPPDAPLPDAPPAPGISLLSYAGSVFLTVNTDRAAVPDTETLVEALDESMRELLTTANTNTSATVR